jgi:hypothetical protein
VNCHSLRLACTALLSLCLASPGQAAGKITQLNVYPPEINLNTALDTQRLIVVATRDDGVTLDVTKLADIQLANKQLCELKAHMIVPKADGDTKLEVEYQGLRASAEIHVKDATADRPISFQLDVMPVFMRGGCNTGSCHGAARGKDGFRLSLFGYDPDGDYFRITRELGPRRINLAVPEESLMVEKSIGAVPHTGGKRFELDSEYCQVLIRWLAAGAPRDASAPPAVVGVDLYPPAIVLEGEGAAQQFIARARYADGSDRDITHLATFLSNNDNSAPITTDGLVKAAARGEAFVMARFDTHTVGNQILVLPGGMEFTAPELAAGSNYIDELVASKLNKLRILPSALCTDEEFLRRATLDLTGRLPTEVDHDAFLADASSSKRAALIDRLLEQKEFGDIWAMKWAELLMIKSTNNLVSPKSAYLYHTWLAEQIRNNVPLDKLVREIISASGGAFKNPPATYYQVERDTLKTSENAAQVFLGIRTQCAQCHNHPFDRWTMNDYYSFAAFFAQVGRKQGEDYRELVVFDRGSGDVKNPVGGKQMKPKFLGGPEPDVAGKDRREVLAGWITSPDNAMFSQSVANRIWAHYFGGGIVEPVDDIRVSNPPSNPALFERLGEKLVEYQFDVKRLVRDICNSHAYQRSSLRNDSNAGDERNFAHGNVRRIAAEQLLDCIGQVTATPDKFAGLPLGSRAVEMADGRSGNYFLTTFGRAARETVCACEAKTEPTLSQALHMLNGNTIQNKVQQGGLVKKLLAEKLEPEQIIHSLYLRALSRAPQPEETERLLVVVKNSTSVQQGLEDVAWAILNSREFLFNH